MSEHQRIAFRAIDGPVTEENLGYMRRQSSRAEITPWSFDNEYQYGDFGGNAEEMLRRGYDLHLHYANFGIRTLLIRLPQGLPDPGAAKPYLGKEGVRYKPDKEGPGGILSIQPFHEPGDLEEIWDFDPIVERLVPLRAEILNGDLRPLYLAHLAIASDGEHDPDTTKEGPLPAGLGQLSDAQRALAELYGMDDGLIGAAAKGSSPMAAAGEGKDRRLEWLQRQPQATKDQWLADWIADPRSTARKEMLTEFRKDAGTPTWPTVRLDRTIAELRAAAEEIRRESDRKASERAARAKEKRLAGMLADPGPTLRETEKLAGARSVENYHKIAGLLAELREALAGSKQAGLAEQQARKLKKENPTLKLLISALRGKGFLPK